MELLLIILSAFMLLITVAAYKCSGGLFSITFVVMVYFVLNFTGIIWMYSDNVSKGLPLYMLFSGAAFLYFLGVLIASNRKPINVRLSLYSPINLKILELSLIISLLIEITVAIYRLMKFGIILFSGDFYSTGMESTAGVSNRLLYIMGVNGLPITALLFYLMYRVTGKIRHKTMAVISFSAGLVFNIFQGTKSAALWPIFVILMALFYLNKKLPARLFAVIGLTFISAMFYIGYFWVGDFSLGKILLLYLKRATAIEVEVWDYLFNSWRRNYPLQYGGTFFLEIERIIAQITGTAKEPLFNQQIANQMLGYPDNYYTDMSPTLTIVGAGFANFGIPGAMVIAFLFGFILQKINLYLLSQETMNAISFLLWANFLPALFYIVKAGNIIIGLEGFGDTTLPILILIFTFYIFLALPFPKALVWRRKGI